MPDVTQILNAIEDGDPSAAEELLPLIYDELRKLAAARMAQESPDHTLQATALVHEAYIRLVDAERAQHWNSRGHFYGAAAEAMRRILVDNARRKHSKQRGGHVKQVDLLDADLVAIPSSDDLLDLNDALGKLEESDLRIADVVKLRIFAGMTFDQIAALTGVSVRTVKRDWTYARAWLGRQLGSVE